MANGYPDHAERLNGHRTDMEGEDFVRLAIQRGIERGFPNCRSAVRDDPNGERTWVVECFVGPFAEQIAFDEPAPRGEAE
jgi:hypothetical protein